MKDLNYTPIGVFFSNERHKYQARRQGVDNKLGTKAYVELEPKQNFEQALVGLEGFERIWLIYDFHQNSHWKPMVSTPRDVSKQGVFATRAPYRPNSIGMSCVKLESIEGLRLFVSEFDLLDQSLILDIKPYILSCDSFEVQNQTWLEQSKVYKVIFSDLALVQMDWLLSQGEAFIKTFLEDQLSKDPLNSKKKRLSKDKTALAYRTWRARFEVLQDEVLVKEIFSGYVEEDFLKEDRYHDFDLHLKFRACFK